MKKLLLLAILAVSSVAPCAAQSLVAHGCWYLGPGGGTTPSINTAGANLIVVSADVLFGGSFSDSFGNSYTLLSSYASGNGSDPYTATFYTSPASGHVGAGHSWTYTAGYTSVCVQAWSGMAATSPLQAGTSTGGGIYDTTLHTGSITPSTGTSVIISMLAQSVPNTSSVDSSFVITDQSPTGSNYGIAMAYKIQSGPAPVNPLWTSGSGAPSNMAVAIAAFSTSATGLSPGVVTKTAETTSSVSLSATAATGGTSPYTYQWYRSTTSGFSPGPSNIMSGQTALTLVDASLTAGTTYYYVIRSTDSASVTADSIQFAEAVPTVTPVILGIIGDETSLGFGGTGGTTPALQMQRMLLKTVSVNTRYSTSNQSVASSDSASWTTGQANLVNAISAFSTAGVSAVMVCLGTYDARDATLRTAGAYQSNLQGMITQLKANGVNRIILNYPPSITATTGGWTAANANPLLLQYQSSLQALAAADPGHVLIGDSLSYAWFQAQPTELAADGVHPTDAGYISLGYLWTEGFRHLFLADYMRSLFF